MAISQNSCCSYANRLQPTTRLAITVRIASRSEERGRKGKPSGKQTFGLLRRRHVRVERIIYIGKESNRLEEIEAGVIHSPKSVYVEYPDPRPDEWQTRILPMLKKIPVPTLRIRYQLSFLRLFLRFLLLLKVPHLGNFCHGVTSSGLVNQRHIPP
jgi:hypothetical protein